MQSPGFRVLGQLKEAPHFSNICPDFCFTVQCGHWRVVTPCCQITLFGSVCNITLVLLFIVFFQCNASGQEKLFLLELYLTLKEERLTLYKTSEDFSRLNYSKQRVMTCSFPLIKTQQVSIQQTFSSPSSKPKTPSFFKVCLKCLPGFTAVYTCMHCNRSV